jgi:hypothetical protein
LFGRLGNLDKQQLEKLVGAIQLLIVDTLELSMRFRRVQHNLCAPQSYDNFANKIHELMEQHHEPTLITFNYDLGLDYALYMRQLKFDYGHDGDLKDNSIPLLKLHGSINWARCPDCRNLEVLGFDKATLDERGPNDPVYMRLKDACLGHQICHGIPREVAIVPPTWNKSQHYKEIANVWRIAARRLSEAENIVILGYSLPATDEFFRYLFALGTVGSARLQQLLVFNPDPEVDKRYRSLFGPMALQRYRLISGVEGYFEQAIQRLVPILSS